MDKAVKKSRDIWYVIIKTLSCLTLKWQCVFVTSNDYVSSDLSVIITVGIITVVTVELDCNRNVSIFFILNQNDSDLMMTISKWEDNSYIM